MDTKLLVVVSLIAIAGSACAMPQSHDLSGWNLQNITAGFHIMDSIHLDQAAAERFWHGRMAVLAWPGLRYMDDAEVSPLNQTYEKMLRYPIRRPMRGIAPRIHQRYWTNASFPG